MIFIFGFNHSHVTPPPPTAQVYSGWEVYENAIYFFVGWWILYWFISFTCRQESEWTCRAVTFVHGCAVTYFALRDIFISKQKFDYLHSSPLSDYQKYYLSITFSYFLFDLIWINFFGSETLVIYMHHILSILFILRVIVGNIGGPGISWGLAGLEFTNPYLQLRWFLRTHGYQGKLIHTFVEVWFIVSFILIRSVGGTYLLYYVLCHPDLDLITKMSFISIYIISWVLTGQILLFFKKKYWDRRHELRLSGSALSIFPYQTRRRRRNVFLSDDR